MSHNVKIGILTEEGGTETERYYGRLHGLFEAIRKTTVLSPSQKYNIDVSSFNPLHAL